MKLILKRTPGNPINNRLYQYGDKLEYTEDGY